MCYDSMRLEDVIDLEYTEENINRWSASYDSIHGLVCVYDYMDNAVFCVEIGEFRMPEDWVMGATEEELKEVILQDYEGVLYDLGVIQE